MNETQPAKENRTRRTAGWVIAVIVIAAAAFFYAHVDVKHNLYDEKLDSSKWQTVMTDNGTVVEQSFVSEEDHIDGFMMQCTTMGDVSRLRLDYTLSDMAGRKLGEGSLSGEDIKSGKFNRLMIEPVDGLKGTRLVFSLTVKDLAPDSQLILQTTPRVEGVSLKAQGRQITDASLVLRTLTHRFNMETFVVTLLFIAFIIAFMKFLFRLFAK